MEIKKTVKPKHHVLFKVILVIVIVIAVFGISRAVDTRAVHRYLVERYGAGLSNFDEDYSYSISRIMEMRFFNGIPSRLYLLRGRGAESGAMEVYVLFGNVRHSRTLSSIPHMWGGFGIGAFVIYIGLPIFGIVLFIYIIFRIRRYLKKFAS